MFVSSCYTVVTKNLSLILTDRFCVVLGEMMELDDQLEVTMSQSEETSVKRGRFEFGKLALEGGKEITAFPVTVMTFAFIL